MADLRVGTWVQIREGIDEYAGMIGPIDWIDQDRAENDVNPYGVDLVDPGDSVFFAADELLILPGKPEGDPRLTRLVTLDGTDYLLVATSETELDEQEQELRGHDWVSLDDAQAIFADLALTQAHMDGLITAAEAVRLYRHCQI